MKTQTKHKMMKIMKKMKKKIFQFLFSNLTKKRPALKTLQDKTILKKMSLRI